MLHSLLVNNYALINELEINFGKGLTTITGETGAGKSILLGALSLILGARADTQVLKDKEQKCIVEGIINHTDEQIRRILKENDIEDDYHLILRREISPNGKSRAFVNDTPVNLPILRSIGIKLIDIHSQHENLDLNSNLYQLKVVDAFAGSMDYLDMYQVNYGAYKQVLSELENLKQNADKNRAELDYLTYQLRELEEAGLNEYDLEELESEAEILRHAEEIKLALYTTFLNISGEDLNAMSVLKQAESELTKIAHFHKPSKDLQARISSMMIELKDIAADAESMSEKIEVDPARLRLVEDRISLIYSLMQKHRVDSVNELILLGNRMKETIYDLTSKEFRMEDLEKELSGLKVKIKSQAEILSDKRVKSFHALEKEITEILNQLGMPNARFKIHNEISADPGETGYDNIRFHFTANRKTELQDIAKIASGGELSRLMLSIKHIISGSLGLPSIIFDEIDTGVSGETAFRVGSIMRQMSDDRQVFVITHLPQVAALGDVHYLVYKNETESGTSTGIRMLSKEERIMEIAKMLSGEKITEASIQNAKELLLRRNISRS